MKEKYNMTMLTDFYELTMANGYFETGIADDIAYFDLFFRKIPDGGGFAIMAGLAPRMVGNLAVSEIERASTAAGLLSLAMASYCPSSDTMVRSTSMGSEVMGSERRVASAPSGKLRLAASRALSASNCCLVGRAPYHSRCITSSYEVLAASCGTS